MKELMNDLKKSLSRRNSINDLEYLVNNLEVSWREISSVLPYLSWQNKFQVDLVPQTLLILMSLAPVCPMLIITHTIINLNFKINSSLKTSYPKQHHL